MKIKGIEIKRFNGNKPAIAYTDFRFVFLSSLLSSKDEYDTALIHEVGHIWLQHQLREKKIREQKKDNFKRKYWLIAVDMEIAKHIYNDNEANIINRPRSILNGGITQEHTEKYPDCVYAEDFYEQLLLNDNQLESKFHSEYIESDEDIKESVEELVENAKKEVEKLQKQKQVEQTQQKINNFTPPKPSLASEIDKYLGRAKILRKASYKRPARRENPDFLKKGMANHLQTPHMTLYVDRSGSFTPQKTTEATQLIGTILKKYRGRITNDVIYFNNTLLREDPMRGDGSTNYQAVVDNIIKERAKLSIIITDNDGYTKPEGLSAIPPTIVVPVGTQRTVVARELNLNEFNF